MIALIRVCPLFWCLFDTGNEASCAIVQLISWCLIVCRYNSHAGLIRDSVMKVMSEDKVKCQLNLEHWLIDWLDSVLCCICNISAIGTYQSETYCVERNSHHYEIKKKEEFYEQGLIVIRKTMQKVYIICLPFTCRSRPLTLEVRPQPWRLSRPLLRTLNPRPQAGEYQTVWMSEVYFLKKILKMICLFFTVAKWNVIIICTIFSIEYSFGVQNLNSLLNFAV